MMRIIAGTLRGHRFNSPNGNKTHPMSDKLRGALFNVLGDVAGMHVLDAFSGSGALAFEAISRGAQHATVLEQDARAYRCIQSNIEKLGIHSVKAIRANASTWSDNNRAIRFDIVICDPPFDNLQHKTIQKLSHHVGVGGLFVLSWPTSEELPELPDRSLLRENQHGTARLVFYGGK